MEQQGKLVKVSPYVIGRTPDYYEDEDKLLSPWVCEWITAKISRIDKRSPVYRLTEEGRKRFDDWGDARAVGYDLRSGQTKKVTPEEIWEELTTNPEYSFKIR